MRRHLRVSTASNLHAGPRRSLATALLLAWATSLTLGLTATVARAQADLSFSATPGSVARGGRIGYSALVLNRGTETKSFDLSMSYDPNVVLLGVWVEADACQPCMDLLDCFPFFGICTDALVCSGSPTPCIVGNAEGTQFTLWELPADRALGLLMEVAVSATAPLTDPLTEMPQLETTAEAAEILSGGGLGTPLLSAANTSVFSDAPKTPFLMTLSGTPPELNPGESIVFRTLVVNRGAFPRDIDISVDFDPSVNITGFHTDDSFFEDPPGVLRFFSVKPGEAIQMRHSGTVDAGTTRSELLSSAVATDRETGFTIEADETTTVLVCDSGGDGAPCDNGDVCSGDFCSSGNCIATECLQACIGAPDGSPCGDADACTVEECIGGECVAKKTSGGVPLEIRCGTCARCDSLLACETTSKAGEVCRAAFSSCDVEEICDGVDSQCPDDVFLPDGTSCDDGSRESIDDRCEAQEIGPPRCLGDPDPCGNGVDDPGEECDPGEDLAGDCCSPTCQFEAPGSSCADATVCNGAETCDGAGMCQMGPALVCDSGTVCATSDNCDSVEGCVFDPEPAMGCLTGFEAASLLINEVHEGRERLVLKLKKGPALTLADFGDPTMAAGTAYTVCFYREDTGDFAGDLQIDRAGDQCGSRSCWEALSRDRGYRYRDREYSADGVGTIKLGGGRAGRSEIRVIGKNNAKRGYDSLPAGKHPPDTGIAKGLEDSFGGVRVQIRSSDGPECFEANLDDVKRSGPTYFKARN